MYLDTSRAIWEPSGQVIRYQGTLVDERREMERQLRRQEELFTAFAGESDARPFILVIDTEGYSFVSSHSRDLTP